MGEQLGLVVGSAERLDPLGCEPVLVGTLGTWDLSIRDVANKHVVERVFRLSLDGGAPLAANELRPNQGTQTLLDGRPIRSVDGCQRGGPEDLADDRRVLQQTLVVVRE